MSLTAKHALLYHQTVPTVRQPMPSNWNLIRAEAFELGFFILHIHEDIKTHSSFITQYLIQEYFSQFKNHHGYEVIEIAFYLSVNNKF